jgi:mannosyl-3-phosphoglycerate synthase
MWASSMLTSFLGLVHEYCKVYAAGLHYALHGIDSEAGSKIIPMVRIKWKSKRKIENGKLVFQESGRCSIVANEWMNRVLAEHPGHHAQEDMIRTANAGEHAMSTDLAMQLCFVTGYAVEPSQLINIRERCTALPLSASAIPPCPDDKNAFELDTVPFTSKVRILQIETCNTHIHDFTKGKDHFEKMQVQGLNTIYHSRFELQSLKKELSEYMEKLNLESHWRR